MKARTIIGVALVIGLAAGTIVHGQPPREGRGGRGGQPGAPGQGGRGGGFGFRMPTLPLLDVLDADKDGQLSPKEIENAVAALKKLDKDGDGKLSQQEIGWPPQGPAFGGRGFGGAGGRGGAGGGRGGAGGPGGGFNMAERIMSNDKNSDGKVSRDELPEFMQRMMERADTNKDGAIDKAEAQAMSEAFGRGGRGGFGGAGGRGGGVGGGRGGRGGAPGGRPQRPPGG